jgi:hypothetical protein
MNKFERASQIWSVLVLAARNRQILSYAVLSDVVGIPPRALAQNLGPIHVYCMRNGIPALTSLVVKQKTGLPGIGFTAAADIPAEQAKVFQHKWPSPPTPREFEKATLSVA